MYFQIWHCMMVRVCNKVCGVFLIVIFNVFVMREISVLKNVRNYLVV